MPSARPETTTTPARASVVGELGRHRHPVSRGASRPNDGDRPPLEHGLVADHEQRGRPRVQGEQRRRVLVVEAGHHPAAGALRGRTIERASDARVTTSQPLDAVRRDIAEMRARRAAAAAPAASTAAAEPKRPSEPREACRPDAGHQRQRDPVPRARWRARAPARPRTGGPVPTPITRAAPWDGARAPRRGGQGAPASDPSRSAIVRATRAARCRRRMERPICRPRASMSERSAGPKPV